MLRVFRGQIYYGQVLLTLAALIAVVFGPFDRRGRVLLSIFCGTVFGWFWLTREEGVWLLPGIGVIVAAGAWNAYRAGRIRSLGISLAIVLCIFSFLQIGFRVGNLLAYGKFVGVDVKEANYERALGAIDSVRSGGTKPFIPVTRGSPRTDLRHKPDFRFVERLFRWPCTSWAG